MALYVLMRPKRSSNFKLTDECFTKQNYGVHPNGTLSPNTPRGVLGGSIAGISGDYLVSPCNREIFTVGLFMNDAAGAAFDNAHSIASGIIAICFGAGIVEVDVYETINAANTADLVYEVGQRLYSSDNGFLTNEPSIYPKPLGTVVKVPTVQSPNLGVHGIIL